MSSGTGTYGGLKTPGQSFMLYEETASFPGEGVHKGRYRLGDESGQALILFVLAMPLVVLVIATLVIDGTNLFVHKRSSQNAADAVALAVAHDLDPYGMPCVVGSACWTSIQTDAGYYGRNNDAADPAAKTQLFADHVCASSSDANCVDIQTCPVAGGSAPCYVDKSGKAHYDKVRITVRRRLDASFGKTVGYSNFKVSATAVAHIEPRGTPLFAFAMDPYPDCNSIRINNGPNTFPTLWSNGGIGLAGSNKGNKADSILLGSAAGACPPLDPDYLSGAVTHVTQRSCTGGGLSSTCYWPSPIPANPCDPTVNYGSVTVGANWTSSNPPGLYCSGTKNNDKIDINGSGMDLTGYTFVAQNNDVTLTGNAASDTFGCTATRPCPVPGTVFFATNGSIGLNSSSCTWTGDSQMYAPNGTITFSGGSSTTFNGLMEAQTLQINGSTTFTGTGALVGSSAVFLDE